MMEVAMLTSGNGAGSKLYTEETFENNDGWGFLHGPAARSPTPAIPRSMLLS